MLQYSVVPPPTLSHDPLSSPRLTHSRPHFPPLSTNFSFSSPTSPATASAKLPRSPYISSRQTSSPVSVPTVSPATTATPASAEVDAPSARVLSNSSSTIEDVLSPGDFIGEGELLQDEVVKLVSIGSRSPTLPDDQEPAKQFQVVRRLGAGSYAVVYLALEVLYRPPPSDDGHITLGTMDIDETPRRIVYGREYAIKCLSKANLDEDALAAQMSEVTIHQSLRPNPNIVTLHRTLETSSFLLLLLEYVPGEDLFYFLEQARDHYETDSPTSTESSTSRTPPTPSLLSTMQPSQLLSRTRLRLISSMFSQMCNAVAACHDQQVYHRDIKPENFIVTDGWTTIDGRTERKVVVKLTDFGLSTTDVDSSDMDCGSAPYMSYECRNNVAPTYRPRAADVWSLGIVLINMLYHYNPWTDTAQHSCSSFDVYRQNPVGFFMERFAGMTRPVAEMLAHHVFNILEHSTDDSARISAADFGIWAKDIPDLLGNPPSVVPRHQRAVSVSSTHGHPISSSIPISHRPSSRQASQAATTSRNSIPASRTHSRTTSTFDKADISELSTVIDQEVEEEPEGMEEQEIVIEGMTSRSTSTNKRRKRGARKGKGPGATPTTPKDETLDTLANASQALAREISRASRASSHRSAASVDSKMFDSSSIGVPPVPPLPSPPLTAPPAPFNVLTKKTSKWRLAFGKSIASAAGNGGEEPPSPDMPSSLSTAVSLPMSATASNVTTLIMGLSAPPLSAPLPTTHGNDSQTSLTWGRGRRNRESPGPPSNSSRRTGSDSSGPSSPPSGDRWMGEPKSDRAGSPNSTRSGRPLASSSSSMTSNNWRNSMSTTSSAGTSTSAFTHYSNSSLRSVSTNATSISSGSWRTGSKSISSHSPQRSPNSANNSRPPNVPRNVKIMDGVPWELGQLPRHLHPSPVEDIFGQPPVRKPRPRKPKDIKLDTITERPPANRKSPESVRRDASTSTTDLGTVSRDDGDYPKKVQKGQINALAKMLSALRR